VAHLGRGGNWGKCPGRQILGAGKCLKCTITFEPLKKNTFLKLTKMTAADIRISAELLKNENSTDLGTQFSDECIHFGSYLKTISNSPPSI